MIIREKIRRRKGEAIEQSTYRQFHFFFFGVDSEWPEALHVLDFEERYLWNSTILLEHVQCAGLGALGTTGHAR